MQYGGHFPVLMAMSALQAIWEPKEDPTATVVRGSVRGWRNRAAMEESDPARSRSPGRHCGVKAMLNSWAKGESSAVTIWRLCHAIVKQDGTDAGHGMTRLAELGSVTSGSEKTARKD